MRYWFTSDWHLSHKNIIKYCNRPFDDIHQMNKTIINNVNDLVKKDDILFFLGDFAFSKDLNHIIDLRNKIQCLDMRFILGNHDKLIRKKAIELCEQYDVFNFVEDYHEFQTYNQHIILTHYCMKVWNKSHWGSWCLYGHSHGSLADDPNSLSLDVGIDTKLYGHEQYTPYSFDELQNIMKLKKGNNNEDISK